MGRDRRKKGRAGPACPELEVGAIPVDFGIIEFKYCATQRDNVVVVVASSHFGNAPLHSLVADVEMRGFLLSLILILVILGPVPFRPATVTKRFCAQH